MAIFEDSLRSWLSAKATTAGSRIYSHQAPERPATPYVVFWLVGSQPLHVHDGRVGMLQRLYQVESISPSQAEAVTLADVIRRHLDGFKGQMEAFTLGSVHVQSQRYTRDDTTKYHVCMVDYMFQIQESE